MDGRTEGWTYRWVDGWMDGWISEIQIMSFTCSPRFRAPKAPSNEPMLYLNGTESGIVNNCCFPSTVSPSYAPAGQALVSVSTIGTFDELNDEDLAAKVKEELAGWFTASETDNWSLIRTYRIPFAQPGQVGCGHRNEKAAV
eukprot:scaffold61933_cov46-Prasinocladus_malaysianus.AAC.2